MRTWEDLLWLFSQPAFIALLLFGLALHPILKYLRRFYPKSLQKIVNDNESFTEELSKNESDSKLVREISSYEGMLIFFPAILISSIYLAYSYFNGATLSPYLVKESLISVFAPIMLISLGVVNLKREAIIKHKLKNNYPRYLEISNKVNTPDPFVIFFEKHKNILGYLFILFGLSIFFT